MSCLKLYWPQVLSLYRPSDSEWSDEPATVKFAAEETPVILKFPGLFGRMNGGGQSDVLSRARLIYANRHCPDCGRAAVVPVDAEQAQMSRDAMPVPGSGNLVGFACGYCRCEWGMESARL